MSPILRAVALAISLGGFLPTSSIGAQSARNDSSAAVMTVERFHAALGAGDSVSVVNLLAANALILESGAIETRAEYLSHHLGADMKASKNSQGTRSVVDVQMVGDAAYVVSKTLTPPTGEQGSTGSQMVELVVLGRTASEWRIQAIHWSSRRRR